MCMSGLLNLTSKYPRKGATTMGGQCLKAVCGQRSTANREKSEVNDICKK